VSWATIHGRNKLYFSKLPNGFIHHDTTILHEKDYNELHFATKLQDKLNWASGIYRTEQDGNILDFTVA
jgi:hypothetical protein